RRAFERREAPVSELDEESPEEEAAWLLPCALVLVPAADGDPDSIRGKQNRAGCGGEEDQHQSPDPSLCRGSTFGREKLITRSPTSRGRSPFDRARRKYRICAGFATSAYRTRPRAGRPLHLSPPGGVTTSTSGTPPPYVP